MIINSIALGLIASVITEGLKLFPFLSSTDTRKRVVAFFVATVLASCYVISQPSFATSDIFTVVIATIGLSFASYKLVIQPAESLLRNKLSK